MPNKPNDNNRAITLPPRKMATIADVARAAGVTTATVSFTLSGKRYVAPETRDAVLAAARKLGYTPNPDATRLAGGRILDLIALFTLTLDQGVGTRKLLLLQRALRADGFRAPIHGYDYNTAFNEAEQTALMRDLRGQRPRAIICATAGVQTEALAELRRFQEEGGLVACLCYGGPVEVDCDQVILDEEDNTYQAARHLLTQGHQRVAFFKTGPGNNHASRYARVEGMKRALAEYGIAWREEWHLSGGQIDAWEESGVELAQRWAGQPVAERPTGLCIVNDRAAQAFVVEVERLGYRVPHDVSVVGHDDLAIARYGRIPLTTVSHPVEEMAAALLIMFRERLTGVDVPPRQVILRGTLIVRDSSGPRPNSTE